MQINHQKYKKKISRVVKLWDEKKIFEPVVLNKLEEEMHTKPSGFSRRESRGGDEGRDHRDDRERDRDRGDRDRRDSRGGDRHREAHDDRRGEKRSRERDYDRYDSKRRY